jgi:hypothetical protein
MVKRTRDRCRYVLLKHACQPGFKFDVAQVVFLNVCTVLSFCGRGHRMDHCQGHGGFSLLNVLLHLLTFHQARQSGGGPLP